jgi:16S rRNA (uracil1498-N3)-methyltransferase
MKLHRFYVPLTTFELKHDFWVHDQALLHQWLHVLRFRTGQELILFDGKQHDRLYKVVDYNDRGVHLQMATQLQRAVPKKELYLFWSLLKRDKNEWVLQKCTELGVRHFVPILTERGERPTVNTARLEKIITEAAEQCGRSDIPTLREPLQLEQVIVQYQDKTQLFVCEQDTSKSLPDMSDMQSVGVCIGPEGGWSNSEQSLFHQYQLLHMSLHGFTLRAETAAIAACALV